MRKYYLQNQSGARLDLNGPYTWLYDVTGLGFEKSNEYADLSQGFFKNTRSGIPQQTIAGTMLFKGNERHTNYTAAVNFLQKAKVLLFVYVRGTETFYRKVEVAYLSRGESTRTQIEASVSLKTLTPWYKPIPVTLQFSEPTGANYLCWGKSPWGNAAWAPNTSGAFAAEIMAEGHIPAAVMIQLNGPTIDHPIITLRGDNGTIYGRCSLEGSYAGTLILNTEYGEASVTVNGEDGIDDLNINYDPFFRIPPGETCTIEIEASTITASATAKMYEYYRSV